MNNKRGQGLSTNAIILIILGVVILVVLIVGFAMGWDKIAPWLSKENVDDVVTGCEVACNTQAEYAFCTQTRELVDAEGNKIETTCLIFSTAPILEPYGIDKCSLDCTKKPCEEIEIIVDGKTYSGVKRDSCPPGDNLIEVSSAASDLATGQKCCVPIQKLK